MFLNKENISKLIISNKFVNAKELEYAFYTMLKQFDNIIHSKKIRVYKDNGVRDDLSLQLNKTSFLNVEDLHKYLSKEFKATDYCVAISEIEKYSHKISDFFISNIIHEWSKNLGEQLLGFELYSFLGKYKITPFGIHDDKEHTILVHLGPNPMYLYCWESEFYESIAGKESTVLGNFNTDISKLGVSPHKVEPGDFIFIPKGMYHAIERSEFSITLGAIPIPLTARKFSERFIQAKLSEIITNSYNFFNYKSVDQIKSEILNITHIIEDGLKNIDFENEITNEYLRLKSNGFLVNRCLVNQSVLDEIKISDYKNIQLKKELAYLLVFINGIELKIRHSNSIEELFNYLNSNKTITKDIMIKILCKEMSLEAAEKVFTLIKSYT